MFKNTAGQIWVVYAYNTTTNLPLAGDAAQITANLRIDGAAADAVDDTNPTELEDGYYFFNLTQAETFGNNILIAPASSTGSIRVIGMPEVVYTIDLGEFATPPGAAVNTPAENAPDGWVGTWGTETLDEDATHALDGTYHDIEAENDTTEKIDGYYVFGIGGDGVPTSVTMTGYLTTGGGLAKNIKVEAYNGSGWDQIGSITSATANTIHTFALFTTHVTSKEVWIRFSTGTVAFTATTTLKVDQIYVSYAVVARSVGYADGAIWVDTVNGTAGTEAYVNGTADNPVDSWADAKTLNTELTLNRFHLAPASSITLDVSVDGYTFDGPGATIALGGQSCSGTIFVGMVITGNDDGSNTTPTRYYNCSLTTNTLGQFRANQCPLTADITLAEAGTYIFEACLSGVAGTSTPSIDLGAALANQNINMRHYSGGIEIKNLGSNGTDNFSLEGHGQYVLNANCAGGTLAVRGHFKKTDNTGGAVSIDTDANFKTSVITEDYAQGAGTGNNQIQLATGASSTDGAYDPSEVFIVLGTGAGQTRLVLEYDGGTRTATVDRNWKVNPDATSEYRIIAHPGREHVNEGLAQAGAAGTITLNALASSDNDAYVNQIVFLRSGTGEDQVRRVSAYNGTSKVATIYPNWDVNPDSTSGYVMLPTQLVDVPTTAEINAEVVDALNVDTYDEPGDEELTVNTSLVDKIGYLYKFLRNKMITKDTGKMHLYNAAETNIDQTSDISDDGNDFTRGEWGEGD